jgi:hypothetical protein
MRHLTPEELIDLAEGTRPESSRPHLSTCERCRRELADMRAMRQAAADVEIPEPSPLFWEHFSARVHESISSESAAPQRWSVAGLSSSRRTISLALGAFGAAAIVAILAVRAAHAPETFPPPTSVASLNDRIPSGDDPSLDLVADLTADIDWETANEVGFVSHEGAVEKALTQLTDAERVELQRLLEQELRSAGD